jgi:peptidoglycan hydrolase-like protein with peptidoglycan-binding domain
MKEDGLDCLNDPFIQAASYPSDDPFATTPLSATPAKPAKPAAAPSPAAAPTPAPANVTAPAPPVLVKVLQNPVLAEAEQLELVAMGKSLLRRGAQGSAVRAIQRVLLNVGFQLPGGANGDFDEGMVRVIQTFQRAHGLAGDGIIGPNTIKKLDTATQSGAHG